MPIEFVKSHQDNTLKEFSEDKLRRFLSHICEGLSEVDQSRLYDSSVASLSDMVSTVQVYDACILAACGFMSEDPEYDTVATRVLLRKMRREVFGVSTKWGSAQAHSEYCHSFTLSIYRGVEEGRLDERLVDGRFDLDELSDALRPERDELLKFIGLDTLYKKYVQRDSNGNVTELPQTFWMRVCMGLAILEDDPTKRAIEFYEIVSQLLSIPSTPTLLQSGTVHPQLSSCYINTVDDTLESIYKTYLDNAYLSKWSGGIGTDWTNLRATGSMVKSAGIQSQGVIPFLKIENDSTVAIARSGKRKGARVAYLETWHLDIEDFLDLRRETGDERRRTHDLHTANWIPDLFMIRVAKDEDWTLFSPDEVPDLHDAYGEDFIRLYEMYEQKAKDGLIKQFKVVKAFDLWRKMITRLSETGHPWITFKDTFNVLNPQRHRGVIHSSNLCCVTGDQLVPTQFGFRTAKDLAENHSNDHLVLAGRNSLVTSSPMVKTLVKQPILKIVTEDGYEHRVTYDHPVWEQTHGWVEAMDLQPGDTVELQQVTTRGGDYRLDDIDVDTIGTGIPEWVYDLDYDSLKRYLTEFLVKFAWYRNGSISSDIVPIESLKIVQILLLNIGVKSKLVYTDQDSAYLSPEWRHFIKPATSKELVTGIREVVEDGVEDVYCVSVNSEDRAWTCNGFITHNTEIAINTDADNCAVCNLQSLNLARVMEVPIGLRTIIHSAIRMLDNVIDLNFYPIPEAEWSNKRDRPIGLGTMGLQDYLWQFGFGFEDAETKNEVENLYRRINYHAVSASVELAKERGRYESFDGSDWSKGVLTPHRYSQTFLPYRERLQDSTNVFSQCRLLWIDNYKWNKLAQDVSEYGMRNSLLTAIAPTASIGTIAGVLGPCIEPIYSNMFVEENLKGEFTIVNSYLINSLKKVGLWNAKTREDIKVHNGSIQNLDYIPKDIRDMYKTAFEIDQHVLIDLAAIRTPFIDQSQSLNIFYNGKSGKYLSELYQYAWKRGLKSTYYLRSESASTTEKVTVGVEHINTNRVNACRIDNPDCEACQ